MLTRGEKQSATERKGFRVPRPRPARPVALGVVLALAILSGAGGLVARRAASAAEPLEGDRIPASDVRTLVSAASSCPALTPARLAGQIMVASGFGNQPVPEMRENGAVGVAALTPAQWQDNVPWPGAQPTDRRAAITALARLMCRLVGQARAVHLDEDPWRIALAAYRRDMRQVIMAGGVPGDVQDYVNTVERYASWYALQPAFASGPTSSAPAATPSPAGAVVPVPTPYVKAVVAAGKICADMPPARVAAQIMVTSGFDPDRLGPAGEQGIAQFTPAVWSAHATSAATKSPWDPAVAIPELGRTMCKLIKQAGGQYGPALAAFARGDEAAPVAALAEAVTRAEAEYSKDPRLQAPVLTPPTTSPSSSSPKSRQTTSKPKTRDNQPAIKGADRSADRYGPYFIVNLVTKMCVDVPGHGAGDRDGPVNQFPCAKNIEDNQEWWFEPRAVDGAGNQLYWIRNIDDKFCIDPPGLEAVAAGTGLNETGCFDRDNQYFRLEPKKSSKGLQYYWLRNTASNMCLDVPGRGDGGRDARLALAPCQANDDHEWALVEKSEW